MARKRQMIINNKYDINRKNKAQSKADNIIKNGFRNKTLKK